MNYLIARWTERRARKTYVASSIKSKLPRVTSETLKNTESFYPTSDVEDKQVL